jgi:hypothetical protein
MIKTNGAKNADESKKRPNEYRRKPKPPSFNKIPAKITLPDVGASQCASGSQIWNGMRGIFTAKDRKKANQQNFSVVGSNTTVLSIK